MVGMSCSFEHPFCFPSYRLTLYIVYMASFLKQGAFFLLLAVIVFSIFLFSSRDPTTIKMLAFPIAIFFVLAILANWMLGAGIRRLLGKQRQVPIYQHIATETEMQSFYELISTRKGRPWMIEELAVVFKKSEEDIQSLIEFGQKKRMLKTTWKLHPITDEEYFSVQLSKKGLLQFKIEETTINEHTFQYQVLEPIARSTHTSQSNNTPQESQQPSQKQQFPPQEVISRPRRGLKARRSQTTFSKESQSDD